MTVEVLVEAAARILDRNGPEGLNTNEIARVAGTSVGTVYRYFPNKHAITAALIAQTQSELLGAFQQSLALPNDSLASTIKNVAVALAAVYQRRRAVHRHLFESMGALGLSGAHAAQLARYAEALSVFLAAHPDCRVANPARAAELIVFTAQGFAYNIAYRAATVSDEHLSELARMYAGYLTMAERG